jgi:hypothetical protein
MVVSKYPKCSSKELVAESDWLASSPIFYDLRRGLVSSKIQEITPRPESFKFHVEGLFNYLDYGYSVFEQTPIEDVRFLRHSSRLWRDESGVLTVEHLPDPFDQYGDWRISESDVIELIRERVQAWEASLPANQEIVLPLSGGLDSRLLLWCLRDPSRVRAYTYGLSAAQERSTEVVHAKALAKRFGIRWERIELGDFHRYFDNWNAEFGLSTHAHGMYHFEFYTKIRERLKGRHAFLSGIFGDVWAGSIPPNPVNSAEQLVQLSYSHGLRADPSRLRMLTDHGLRDKFWSDQRERLADHSFQVVSTVRLKILLISYLMRVPRLFDFEPWSPFLDSDVAMAMLNLPRERRVNRQWQRDFFAKVGLDLESQGLTSSRSNNLDLQGLKRIPLQPLNVELLSKIIDSDYLSWVNKTIKQNYFDDIFNYVSSVPKIGGVLRRLNLSPRTLEAYSAYLCLKPIAMATERSSGIILNKSE